MDGPLVERPNQPESTRSGCCAPPLAGMRPPTGFAPNWLLRACNALRLQNQRERQVLTPQLRATSADLFGPKLVGQHFAISHGNDHP